MNYYLALEMVGYSSVSSFLSSLGSHPTYGNCEDFSDPFNSYTPDSNFDSTNTGYSIGQWYPSPKSYSGTTYALYRIDGYELDNFDIGTLAARDYISSSLWLYVNDSGASGDQIVYLNKYVAPTLTSISIKIGGSYVSSSTSIKVDEQKEIQIIGNYSNGETMNITTSASLTRSNTNISIV